MLGAIVGDIIGSPYEFNNIKSVDFPLFSDKCKTTDDSICTAAIASKLVYGGNYQESLLYLCNKYPHKGWGKKFSEWIVSPNPQPYASWGNGAAMRVSAIGWWFDTLEDTLREARESCECTHNHESSYKAAQAVAGAIFMLRTGESRGSVREWISSTFGYNLERTVDQIRPEYKFDVSCDGSVPEAIIAFLESASFEQCARLAVSMGGDSDTICAIACSLSEAEQEIPNSILINAAGYIEPEILQIWTDWSNAVAKRRGIVYELS